MRVWPFNILLEKSAGSDIRWSGKILIRRCSHKLSFTFFSRGYLPNLRREEQSTLALTLYIEEAEGGEERPLLEGGGEAKMEVKRSTEMDSPPTKVHVDEHTTVEIPETAHQISRGTSPICWLIEEWMVVNYSPAIFFSLQNTLFIFMNVDGQPSHSIFCFSSNIMLILSSVKYNERWIHLRQILNFNALRLCMFSSQRKLDHEFSRRSLFRLN